MGHGNAARLHRVVLVIVKFTDLFVEEIGHVSAVLHIYYNNTRHRTTHAHI